MVLLHKVCASVNPNPERRRGPIPVDRRFCPDGIGHARPVVYHMQFQCQFVALASKVTCRADARAQRDAGITCAMRSASACRRRSDDVEHRLTSCARRPKLGDGGVSSPAAPAGLRVLHQNEERTRCRPRGYDVAHLVRMAVRRQQAIHQALQNGPPRAR